MNLPDPDSKEWDDYNLRALETAVMAQMLALCPRLVADEPEHPITNRGEDDE